MAKPKVPVSINGIEFDALISEERTLSAQIPEYAVEDGFSVSDSILLDAEALSMTLYVTNTPVTWHNRHGSDSNRVASVITALEKMYFNAEPVKIVTSERTYTDMAIENLTLSKSVEEGYSREIPISFKKIRITKATTTTIPASYCKSGTTGASAGTANTSSKSASNNSSGTNASNGSSNNSSNKSGDGSKSSILYSAAKSAGLI